MSRAGRAAISSFRSEDIDDTVGVHRGGEKVADD
jgi:hypothetical protein